MERRGWESDCQHENLAAASKQCLSYSWKDKWKSKTKENIKVRVAGQRLMRGRDGRKAGRKFQWNKQIFQEGDNESVKGREYETG